MILPLTSIKKKLGLTNSLVWTKSDGSSTYHDNDVLHIKELSLVSREDDDDVRDIGKHDFHSVLLHSMLSNDNTEG